MIADRQFLIPIIDNELRSGTREFRVTEGWRDDTTLFTGRYGSGEFSVTSTSRYEYSTGFPDHREFPNFNDLIQKVLHGSGIIDMKEIGGFMEKYGSIVGDDERYKRNARFYYDTNSLMNNYFFIFREFIPGFLKNAGHTTSYGVMAELENLFDRKLAKRFFPEEFSTIYGPDEMMFSGQPNLVGRFARLAYPELDFMKTRLRSNVLTDYETGDSNILNSFISDCNENNLEGIMVTNDSNMAERASKRMGSWHVRFGIDRIVDLPVNVEFFLEALYRASVIYGRIRINDDIVIDGLWRKKDWGSNSIKIVRCPECGLERIKKILEKVPPDFQGRGYYGSELDK